MSKVKCAAGLDSLNVREMADVPEIDIDKMEDKEVTERFRREWKAAQYADLKGRRFRPTFSSNIDFFEIRGYDAERDMVLTTAHPKGGSAFDDEIEERYLAGAFETGEYVALPMSAASKCQTTCGRGAMSITASLPKEKTGRTDQC